ncbi:hypothetical protein GIB67_021996 [Kingdonia uniflora]|uniref:Uncharacterized protein n=1 Tax=Kingdonia uniflora TaxID=39325 RepID=A0A7J7P7V4_9MAGN|nr:hypothetical protein GIB67_021996 [Kingdonia uniflora]
MGIIISPSASYGVVEFEDELKVLGRRIREDFGGRRRMGGVFDKTETKTTCTWFCRLETAGIRKREGQAKVLGIIACVAGAMLISFYKEKLIDVKQPHNLWSFSNAEEAKNIGKGFTIMGPLLVMASNVAFAAWLIIQVRS